MTLLSLAAATWHAQPQRRARPSGRTCCQLFRIKLFKDAFSVGFWACVAGGTLASGKVGASWYRLHEGEHCTHRNEAGRQAGR